MSLYLKAVSIVLLSLVLWSCSTTEKQSKLNNLEITLESNNKNELEAKNLIEKLSYSYNLSKYYFTKKVHIKSFATPHSHPILTLNTRNSDNPDKYLSLFIHEQTHWMLSDFTEPSKLEKFISKMKLKYPKLPSQQDGGAFNDYSTYLHLAVCFFELEQLEKLIGADKAKAVFNEDPIYKWVRSKVLSDRELISSALKESELVWQDASEIKR